MAKRLIITGLVQGVYYRASFEAQARELGLSGWVRNRANGSVEALVAGETQAIERIVEWARRGPPRARVDEVAVMEADDAEAGIGFSIRPTV